MGVESIVFYTEDGDYVTSVSGSTRNGLVKTNNDNNAGDFKYDLPSGKYYYAEVTVLPVSVLTMTAVQSPPRPCGFVKLTSVV